MAPTSSESNKALTSEMSEIKTKPINVYNFPVWLVAWSRLSVSSLLKHPVTQDQTQHLNIPHSLAQPGTSTTAQSHSDTLYGRDQGFSRPVKGGISIGVRTVDLDHHWRHPPPILKTYSWPFLFLLPVLVDEIGDRGILWVWIRPGCWSRDNGMDSRDHVARRGAQPGGRDSCKRCAHACRLQGVGWSAGEVQVQVKDRCTLAHWPHWSLGAHWVH